MVEDRIHPIRVKIKQRIIDDKRKKETEKRASTAKRNEGKQGVQEGQTMGGKNGSIKERIPARKDSRAENEIMDLLKKYVTLKVTVESFRKSIGRYLLGTEDIEWAKKTIRRKMKTYSSNY